MKFSARRLSLLAVVVAALVVPACSRAAQANPSPTYPAPVSSREALATLDSLRVAGRAAKTGYTREQFGPAWTDDVSVPGGHNNCDTRNDILKRDMVDLTYKDNKQCTVATGTLHDAYTGKTIKFVRGPKTSDDVQIDHVIALSDAWQKGAQQLSEEKRRDLANDPLNLQAVDGPTNQGKSDSDAATWLPPNKGYRCAYVTRQIQVKAAYQLWVTQGEKDAMTRELTSCP
ncbi:HNH endonuclease family protein [Nocardia sp. NPDC052566]|uniref:HNH endonuclease family protein n=1 Tax=Nocardia sp. NPDC052566 TaxID=3364330 RepID=UPI0037CB0BF6